MEKSNKIKSLLNNTYNQLKTLVGEEDERVHIQFLVVCSILAFVSLAMTVMNLITDWRMLMWSTLVFGIANIINVFLIYKKGVTEMIGKFLFGAEFLALFTFFVVVGEPEGFSAIWAAMLPSCGLLLYKAKKGSFIVLIEFIILIFFFWTPVGRSLLQYDYTESFMERFPLLYSAFYIVGIFFEFVRQLTQSELVIAKNKYHDLYDDEAYRAKVEKTKNYEIIDVLASEYSIVAYVNLVTEEIERFTIDKSSKDFFQPLIDADAKFPEVFKKYVEEFILEEDQLAVIKSGEKHHVMEKLQTEKTYVINFRAKNNGDPHYCEMKYVKVDDITQSPTKFVLAIADRDHIIRHEQERNVQLKVARDKAEAASKAKSTFLFNMSHDIRTPMNAIIGFTDIAKRNVNNPEKVSEYLEKVAISSENLLNLVNDVLDMSRIESGKVDINLREKNIMEFIKELETMVVPSAEEHKINLKVVTRNILDDNVLADDVRLNETMVNVISNAIKYTKAGGNVIVTIEQLPDEKEGCATLKFIVKDTGIGMSQEFLGHIYDTFSRENSSTVSGVQGTGLGMSIVKRLVDLMEGTINITSQKDVGTTVEIKISFERVKVSNTEDAKIEDNAVSEKSLNGVKALLVEDNELNREIAREILMEEGMIIEDAEDGSIAVEMLKEKGPSYYDMILMDIQMPTMDGYTATKTIRAMDDEGFKTIPIIAMTANAFEEDRKYALSIGMNAHLAKPINPALVISTLKDFVK